MSALRLQISGYASLFNQSDLSGDQVRPGAFSASILALENGRLPMLFGHETANPIGVWERIIEDKTGLFVSGHILGGTAQADRTARLIKEGALSGLSIGYRTRRSLPSSNGRTSQGRILTELDLWEVSVVAFPMLRSARITQIDDLSPSYIVLLKTELWPMPDLETKHLNMKDAQADFARTFTAFKSANDERLSALESKSSDILMDEKVARLNTALDAQSKQIENLSLTLSAPMAHHGMRSEAKSAWSSFIRTGDAQGLSDLEGKSLSSLDGEGGYIAPVETESRIDVSLAESSPLRSICTVRRIGAGLFKKPVSTSGAAAGWAGETEARIETQAPQLELLDFPAGELYAMPAATQALLDDGVADVDQWLADEVRDVFAAQETSAFIGGDGINKPKGLLSYTQADNGTQSFGEIGALSTGVAGAFDGTSPVDAILDLIYAGKSRYRAGSSFVMNRRTVSDIRKFKDADGNYIWQPASQAGQPSTLLGYPLVEAEDMPDISTGNAFMAFGDFRRGYLIVDRQGVRVLRDPYSAKPYVLFYTTKRVGGGVQDFEAIKLLKAAA